MSNIKDLALTAAKKKATWLALLALGSLFGLGLSPEQSDTIASAGVAVADVLGIVSGW